MNRRRRLVEQVVNLTLKKLYEGQEEVDAILGKIKRDGLGSLSSNEKRYLDYYAETGDFDDELLVGEDIEESSEFEAKLEALLFTDEVQELIEIDPENVEFLTTRELEAYQELYTDTLIELSELIVDFNPGMKPPGSHKQLRDAVGPKYYDTVERLQEVGEMCVRVLIDRGY